MTASGRDARRGVALSTSPAIWPALSMPFCRTDRICGNVRSAGQAVSDTPPCTPCAAHADWDRRPRFFPRHKSPRSRTRTIPPLAVAVQISATLAQARNDGQLADHLAVAIDSNVQQMIDFLGVCERIHRTPLPFGVCRASAPRPDDLLPDTPFCPAGAVRLVHRPGNASGRLYLLWCRGDRCRDRRPVRHRRQRPASRNHLRDYRNAIY